LLRAYRREGGVSPIGARLARLLLDACRGATDATARRDSAVVSLLLLAGLRRRELIGLRRGDYDESDGRIEVKTRRGERRSILLEGDCRGDLEHWLTERGSGGGPLFLAYSSSGAPVPRGIAASTVNGIVARRCAEAGLDGLTPGLLRSRFVWQLQSGSRQGNGSRCRYYLAEDGQPGWVLSSLSGF
jgi:integrase